jgi:putative restriction endonuclease
VRDDDVRSSCFNALDVLCAEFGDVIPVVEGLDRGFAFRGRRVPFLNRMKGIHRASVQRGPAALSIQTSAASPYADAQTDEGFIYAYRAGAVDQPDNLALRAAHALEVPIVYFIGTLAGRYQAIYPCYVTGDDPAAGAVFVSVGRMAGLLDERFLVRSGA